MAWRVGQGRGVVLGKSRAGKERAAGKERQGEKKEGLQGAIGSRGWRR